MKKMLNNKKILIIIVSSLALICLTIILINVLNDEENENIYDDNIPNNEIISDENKVVVSEPKEFLTSNCLISTSDVVASEIPDGYVFLSNGKFAYYNPNFYIRFNDKKENRLMSYVGTWTITDDKLILNITDEEYAVGGTIVNNPIAHYLSDYTKEVKKVNKIIEYTINRIINNSNEHRTPHLYLTHNNNNEVRWYSLPVGEDYLTVPTSLAENGYGAHQDKTAKEFSNSIIDIQKYITLNKQDNNYSNYTIDLNTAFKDNKLQGLSILEEYNINFKYKLNDYEIQLKLKDNDDLGAYVYGVYINDKHIYDDYAFSSNNIEIDTLGKYLLFRYNGCTDIRCQRLILTDNTGTVTSLYELDDVSGLVATLPTISNDGITLKATRITHNGAIVYDDEIYEVYHNDECKNTSSILPDNLLIQATYTYKFNDDVLNLTPEVTNKITLDEYLKDENNCN